jgi:hypothetical protein
MKKQSINTIAKKFFAGSIIAAVLFLSAQTKTNAQSSIYKNVVVEASAQDNKLQVKYLGNNEDGVLFNVKYNNANAADFSIIVTDETGEVLYKNDFNDKNFDRKFMLPKIYSKVVFSVRNDKDKSEQAFTINVSSRIVEDVVVSRN